MLVKWKGFDYEDPEWKSIITLHEDVLQLLQEFLDNLKNTGTVRQKRVAAIC